MSLLGPRLSLKISQKQILTPGLVQMVTVLQLNRLELKEMITQEIVKNPVLEEAGEDLGEAVTDPRRYVAELAWHKAAAVAPKVSDNAIVLAADSTVWFQNKIIGKPAIRKLLPMQAGDVLETRADISALQRDVGFAPSTTIAEGLARFVAWYREYHGV